MGRSLQEIDAAIAALQSERDDITMAARPPCPVEIRLIVDTARSAAMSAVETFYDGRGWGAHIVGKTVHDDCGCVATYNAAVFTMDEYNSLVRRMK